MKAYKCRVCLCATKDDKIICLASDRAWLSYYENTASKAIDESIQRAWKEMCGISTATEFEISIYLESFVEFDNFYGTMSTGLGLALVRHKGADCKTVYDEAKAKVLAQIGEEK